MKSQLHVALGMLAAVTVFAGCQGGATVGNGGATPVNPGTTPTPVFSLAPGQSPTPTSSSSPTPVGATPSPTPTPSSVVTGAIYHPGNNGDTFTMNGTLLVTFDRSNQYPSPEPISTTMYGVTQSVAVTNPASYNGATNAVDFKISETDTSMPSGQTFSDTMDQYFQYSNSMATGNFLNLGYTEVDDTGYTVDALNGANDRLADILPEAAGATWSNMGGHSFSTNDGNGETSSTNYNDDGSYTGTITYQNYPNASGSTRTAMANLTANIDGSADYKTPRLGTTFVGNYDYAISAPSGATIAETTTIPPAAGGTPNPVSTSIPNWQPASMAGKFSQETDVDNGPKPLPSPCIVPSGYAAGANQIVQTKMTLDPLNGELDTTTTTTYDTVNVGPVCVILHDVQTDYYDFSGQNGAGYFSGTPQQITTIDEVLYLSVEALQSTARRSFASDRQLRSVNIPMLQARIASLRGAQRLNRLVAAARGRSTRLSSRSFRGMLK